MTKRLKRLAMTDNLQQAIANAPLICLEDYISQVETRNTSSVYGFGDVRGVSNTKGFINTRANIEGRDLKKFLVVAPEHFVFNRRTTRNGERLGLAFNMSDRSFILTDDYVVFKVKPAAESSLLPAYLYLHFLRDEFDRYVRTNSWGSATEFFNWDDMCRVKIPLPPIEVQQQYVDAYQGLTAIVEQNEALLKSLEETAQACVAECREKWPMVALGACLQETNTRNTDGSIKDVRGISTTKRFREPNSRVDRTKLHNYKIVQPRQFAYVPTTDTWRCLAVCLSSFEEPIVVSPIYITFKVKDDKRLLPEFLQLYFQRPETDRHARFNSWGSARESFNWDDMCRMKIPLPPIEVQQAIVSLYHCAEEARKIANEAKKQLVLVCPAMIQRASHIR